jgi:hypothetical protein
VYFFGITDGPNGEVPWDAGPTQRFYFGVGAFLIVIA